MKFPPRVLLVVVMAAGAVGCVHYRNVEPCNPSRPGATECFQSSHAGPGQSTHQIREEVVPAGPCDRIELEQVELDGEGRVRGRSREARTCGALLVRRTEVFDATGRIAGVEVVEFSTDDDERPTYRRRWGTATPELGNPRARRLASRP